MDEWSALGKGLVFFGLIIALIGLGLMLADKMPFLGRLPGDLHFQWKNVTVYVPIVTCIVISVILTIILNLFFRR